MFEDFKEKVRRHMEVQLKNRLFKKVFGKGRFAIISEPKRMESVLFGKENNN